jgi:hypothetical protein
MVVKSQRRRLEGPRNRWKENIKMHYKEIGCEGLVWMKLAQFKFEQEVLPIASQ